MKRKKEIQQKKPSKKTKEYKRADGKIIKASPKQIEMWEKKKREKGMKREELVVVSDGPSVKLRTHTRRRKTDKGIIPLNELTYRKIRNIRGNLYEDKDWITEKEEMADKPYAIFGEEYKKYYPREFEEKDIEMIDERTRYEPEGGLTPSLQVPKKKK